MLRRGSIQKGSVITFVRGAKGRVTASAGGQQLASVRSPALAAALFDLYIGDQVRRPRSTPPPPPHDCAQGLGTGRR